MMPDFPPTVPVIGLPFDVLVSYPTVILQCRCPAKVVLALVDAQVVVRCPSCQKAYAIAERPKVRVGQVRPQVDG